MSRNYIEMFYDKQKDLIGFIYKGITIEYKRFNGGNMVDSKKLQQVFFEYLYENQGKLIIFEEFINEKVKMYPFLSRSRNADTRNILHNLFDFTLNPWIRLFFPIRCEKQYKFKNKVTIEELKEKELLPLTIKRPTRKK